MSIFLKPNPASGVPIYQQLKEQIRHAVETGVLRPGDGLPAMRTLAEELVVNANTVARVYRELGHEGLLELRHGVGVFVAPRALDSAELESRAKAFTAVRRPVRELIASLRRRGLATTEIRRLVEAELARSEVAVPAGFSLVSKVAARNDSSRSR